MTLPKTTLNALDFARQHYPRTKRDNTLLALFKLGDSEGWVGAWTLSQHGGLRFGGRIFELRESGVRIEKRVDPRKNSSAYWQYRLVRR